MKEAIISDFIVKSALLDEVMEITNSVEYVSALADVNNNNKT